VRSLGADVVVDYRDPAKAVKQIREAAPGPIEHALDCVSTGTSFEIVAASLDDKGTIANLGLGDYPTVEGVKVINGIIFEYFGKVSVSVFLLIRSSKSKIPPSSD
jgi:NADPH:quinone reductase-like Zn-dependent oxidoreductase